MSITLNPVIYFEIPVNDMDRAIEFYSAVFDFTFEKNIIDHNEMAFFPFEDGARGITGALAKGEIYIPTLQGILIYFSTNDIDLMLEKLITYGGEILYPKTSNGELGYVAEFKDCEGNRIALHQK
jgi:predicted enzyme related to lactoylglutathione lyase